MPWIGPAVIGGASIVGGLIGSSGSKQAASQQAGAIDRATKTQVSQDALNRQDNAPFLRTGTAANKRLAQLLGISAPAPTWEDAAAEVLNQHKQRYGSGYTDGSDMNAVQAATQRTFDQMTQQYQGENANRPGDYGSLSRKFTSADLAADPVYSSGLQFGLDEGTKGINARAMQAGGYDSGATLKALTRFGTDYGSTKAGESYNRFTNDQNNTFNRLSGVSGTGQVATNQVASSGTNMANNVSNLTTEGGNARAAGIVGGANAWGSAATGVGNAAMNYQNSEFLRKLLAGKSGGFNPSASYGGQNLAQDDYSAGYYGANT